MNWRGIIIGMGIEVKREKYTTPVENIVYNRNIMANTRKMENKKRSRINFCEVTEYKK